MVREKEEYSIRAASEIRLAATGRKCLFLSEDLRHARCYSCQCKYGEPDGRSICYCSTTGYDTDWHDHSKEGYDEAELETAIREFISGLISLLDPLYAEVVWRAEILDQPEQQIALKMNLSEPTVAECLQAGHSALLHLVMLTLQQSLEK
jgi:DNA-directed RNA polymerase specialized sigma24 family protein